MPFRPERSDLSFDPLLLPETTKEKSTRMLNDYLAPDFLDYDRAFMSSRIPKRRKTNPSIDRNYRRPVIAFERIPVYDHDKSSAPRRDFLMVCERPVIDTYISSMEAREPLMVPNTTAVNIWRRGDRGMALRNRLDICNHYEIAGKNLERFQQDATKKSIIPVYHPANGKAKMVNEGGHYLFLCNGGDFQGILEDMDLRSIVDDVCTNADPGQVPKKNSRGNRGPSLLFTGSQSQQRKSTSQFAEPVMSPGSKRYAPLYCKITKAVFAMAAHQVSPDVDSFPDPFPVLVDMPSRQEEWAGQAGEGNCVESCSFLIYISDHPFSKEGCDKLQPHVDKGNGRKAGWDWLATFWEEFFSEELGRWFLFVVSATSRRSIEEHNDRKGCIGFATDELLDRYSKHPDYQKHVIPATLCPKNEPCDHRTMPIHFDTLVFLSVLLWHIQKMRRFWSSRGEQMSIFLAQEMIMGFFKTNNPLRFHRFAEKIYNKTVIAKRLAIPSNSTYLHELQTFLFTTYGGWNGTSDEDGRSEGTMRFQTCTNNPQTDWAQDQSLVFWFSYSTELASPFSDKMPTEKDHLNVVRQMKDAIIGVLAISSHRR
jgi:hypothetical protein